MCFLLDSQISSNAYKLLHNLLKSWILHEGFQMQHWSQHVRAAVSQTICTYGEIVSFNLPVTFSDKLSVLLGTTRAIILLLGK